MRALLRFRPDDLLLRLIRDCYNALAVARADSGAGDRCPMRMLGRPALAVRGDRGARLFYDESLMRRHGAVPLPVRMLLFGPGAIHGLDGAEHKARKRLFFDIVTPASVTRLAGLVDQELQDRWAQERRVTLFDDLVDVYGSSVIRWAGIDCPPEEASRISRELALIVDGFGIGGTPYPRAALARLRAQRWAVKTVRRMRAAQTAAAPGTALQVVAASRLPDLVAATELLNVLRPTVAVSYFGTHAAVRLAAHPDWRQAIAEGSDAHRRAFQLELRRWLPFAPLLAARTRRPVDDLPAGAYVVLDIFGTNRDPYLWEQPTMFDPGRFLEREPGAYDFVPQGGGFVERGHRCPGEPIAEAVLEVTLERLAAVDYELGRDADEVPLDRIPSLSPDRVLITVRSRDRLSTR